MTLTEFLLARIAEDEAVARAARMKSGEWDASEVNDNPRERLMTGAEVVERAGESGYLVTANTRWPGMLGNDGVAIPPGPTGIDQLAHIARHDPARVLAECEAKRRIVSDYREWVQIAESDPDADYATNSVGRLADVLWSLAFPFSNHPDFREEWLP